MATLRTLITQMLGALSSTPGAGKIPVADSEGHLDPWVTLAAAGNIDGGDAYSVYGGSVVIDAGDADGD